MDSGSEGVLKQPCAFKLVYDPADHTVNDHCLVRDDAGVWHLFYIYFPRDGRRSSGGQLEYGIGHARSRDLLAWEEVGICLREDGGTWEGDAIYAPNVHRAPGGGYVMLYCGSRAYSQQIGAAVSEDLMRWEKHPGNPVITPPEAWSGWRDAGYHSCRDAHILEVEPGRFVCYYTADDASGGTTKSANGGTICTNCCIAAAESLDLLTWTDIGPVYAARRNLMGPGQTMMESSGVVVEGEGEARYVLYFTHRFGVSTVRSSDPFSFEGPTQLLGAYHASEIFRDPGTGSWFITSCLQRLGSLHIPEEVLPGGEVQESCGLFLAGLVWIEGYPVVVDLERMRRAGRMPGT